MAASGRTESLDIDRRHPTQSGHREFIDADIRSIERVVNTVVW